MKEVSRPEKASVFAKRASHAAALQLKKPASSVEADITGSTPALPKHESDTASSKSYSFKTGIHIKLFSVSPYL